MLNLNSIRTFRTSTSNNQDFKYNDVFCIGGGTDSACIYVSLPDCRETIPIFTVLLNVDIFEKIKEEGETESPDRGGC